MEPDQTYDTRTGMDLFGEGIVKSALAIYLIPTAVRTFKEIKRDYANLSTKQKIGLFVGAGSGGVLDILQIAGCYNMAFNEGFPLFVVTVLGIPNISSGIYEINRKIRSRKLKNKSLEGSVEQ